MRVPAAYLAPRLRLYSLSLSTAVRTFRQASKRFRETRTLRRFPHASSVFVTAGVYRHHRNIRIDHFFHPWTSAMASAKPSDEQNHPRPPDEWWFLWGAQNRKNRMIHSGVCRKQQNSHSHGQATALISSISRSRLFSSVATPFGCWPSPSLASCGPVVYPTMRSGTPLEPSVQRHRHCCPSCRHRRVSRAEWGERVLISTYIGPIATAPFPSHTWK